MGRPKPSPLPAITTETGFNGRGLGLCLLLCAGAVQPAGAADYTYVKVGVPAQTGSSALAMDNNGRVATTSLIRSYLFADNFFANYVEITNVNIATSTPGLVAQGLNDVGELVGRFRTNGAPANQTRGFVRRANGTFEPFDYPGVASTSVSEINNHGHLVGETRSDLTSFGLIRGFVHTNGVSAEIHFPGATLTRGYGINDAGDIVGQYQMEDAVSRPFLLRNGVYSQIVPTNAPGGLVSGIAFSISDNGLVLGTYRDQANVAKTWVMRADGSFEYPVLPGTGRVINKAGQIAGSFADPANANATTPFVATPFVPANYVAHRMALTNSASGGASKINDQGQITGTVDGTDGVSRGYRFDTKTRQEVERGGFGESAFTEWGGINSAGTLAGYYADPADPSFNTYRAFVRDAGGHYQSIIWSGDTNFGFTVDIDEHGRVAGGGGTTAWVWDTNGTFNVFNVPGFTVNGAFGMNDHGLVVGAAWPGFFDTPNGLIYNISNNTATIWNYPAAAQTTLYGINNRGDIVGEFKPNLTSANIPFVRWADGTTQILNFAGLAGVRVYDLNDDRVVVGRYKDAANKNQPFFATPLAPLPEPLAFTFETFDVEGASETLLSDIRNDGTLVGRFKDSGGISQGFVQEGTNRTVFNVTGTTATFPGGIDSLGRVAGFYRNATNPEVQHGFIRDTNGVISTIDGPGQTFTYAWRINDSGQVNGYWFEDPFFITSFRRATNGALATNVFAGSPVGTVTRGMNEAGDTAGWKWDENFTLQGVIFAGGMTNVLTVAGWQHTLPGDLNNFSDIAGTVNNGFTNTAGFFRRANGDTVVFTPPGAVEVEVFGLNDLGQVVGEYVDAGGNRHGFIAHPAAKLPRGHTDIGIAFEDGAFDLHIHDEEADTEYAPGGAVLCVLPAAEQPIPDTAALSFLGQPGYSTWILPAVENPDLLFLGFGAEEVKAGVFVGDVLRMELVSVTGAGDFAVFAFDGFGHPVVHMNSADGIGATDFFPLVAGGHTDLNWAFSAPGTYRVGFRARGTLVDGDQEVVSDIAFYTFVVPEPLLPQPVEQDDSIAYKFEVIEAPGAEATYAFGLNSAGLIVGRFNDAGVGRGYVRETGGVIAPTNFPGATFTETFGINSNGFIVGWYKSASNTNGFLLATNGAFETISLPGATVTFALGINASNTITGAYQDGAGVQHGFIRDAAGNVTSFDPPGSIHTEAYGINDAGTVVGYFVDSQGERGFVRRTDGSFDVFDVPGSDGSGILGINNAGTWTGFLEDASGVHGFARSADGVLTALNFPDSSFTVALGVSDDGVVVGYTADATGTVRGFIARSATRLKSGHTDIGLVFEGGAFEFEVHAEDTDTEYSPDAALLHLPPLTQTVVPTNAAYAFLGAAGAPMWVLPGVENPKLLFLGLAAEEIQQGVFVNDELRFTLKGVEGPGEFALYSIDGFSVPQVHMNSGDGLNAADVQSIQAGSHEDFYWAFTAPGLYRVKFQASGTLVEGSQFVESDEVEYCFEVTGIETRLAIARSGGNATISFVTQDGLTYQLESAPTVTGPWTNEGAAFLGTGREKAITVPLSPVAQFFKMKAGAGN